MQRARVWAFLRLLRPSASEEWASPIEMCPECLVWQLESTERRRLPQNRLMNPTSGLCQRWELGRPLRPTQPSSRQTSRPFPPHAALSIV